tara:strand:- start:14708 stop:14815 length:108 start_codon:yes stop_codon:yes gene_type:complete
LGVEKDVLQKKIGWRKIFLLEVVCDRPEIFVLQKA